MSQAEELLRSIVEDSDEAHIVVGLDRKITVPAELKNIAVQYDTNIRTVTFDIPRYYDGRDLYAMTLFVYCQKPDGTVNSYPAEDVSIDTEDETLLHFKWTIASAVTSLPGKIKISISAKSFDESGNIDKRWSSEINEDLTISPNYQSDDALEEESPDTVSQIYSKIDTVEKALSNHDHDARYYRKEVLDEALVAPDWNQNDETASNYIKNRPFYTGDPVETVLVDNVSVTIENGEGVIQTPITFTEGDTYKVEWNGTAYECVAYKPTENGQPVEGLPVIVGDASAAGLDGGNGEPFLIFNEGTTVLISQDGTYTVSISVKERGIHEIDKKYLGYEVTTTTLFDGTVIIAPKEPEGPEVPS